MTGKHLWGKGYLQVYTGDGKGKTTAAMGLALRCTGAGGRVFIGQFVKGMHYAELDALARLADGIAIRQFGRDCFIVRDPEPEDIRLAREGLDECRRALESGEYDLVILDEASIAVYYQLFSATELLEAIAARQPHVEVVVTGRRAPPELVERADLVTEMKEVKHYYTGGVVAREGIEK